MRAIYSTDTVSVHQGDALAVLASLPDSSVHAVITDPPYSSGGFTRGDRMLDTASKYQQSSAQRDYVDFAGDNRDQRGYAHWCALWLAEALRVTKSGGTCLLFTDWRQLPATTDALQAGGWVWRGLIPWAKPSARPQSGRFTNAAEYVVWGSKGPMPVDYSAPVLPGWFLVQPPRDREHLTQKPLDLMRGLVQIAPRGGTVLDPFVGSGTTGVAALAEGRRFVGIEITEHYAQVAANRLRQASTGWSAETPEQGVLL